MRKGIVRMAAIAVLHGCRLCWATTGGSADVLSCLTGTNLLGDLSRMSHYKCQTLHYTDLERLTLSNWFIVHYGHDAASLIADHADQLCERPGQERLKGLLYYGLGKDSNAFVHLKDAYQQDTNDFCSLHLAALLGVQHFHGSATKHLLAKSRQTLPEIEWAILANADDLRMKHYSNVIQRSKALLEREGTEERAKYFLETATAGALMCIGDFEQASYHTHRALRTGIQDTTIAMIAMAVGHKQSDPEMGRIGGDMLLRNGVTNRLWCLQHASALVKLDRTPEAVIVLKIAMESVPAETGLSVKMLQTVARLAFGEAALAHLPNIIASNACHRETGTPLLDDTDTLSRIIESLRVKTEEREHDL